MSDGTRGDTNLRRDGAKTTKYPTRGVLHDFARCDEDFRRV